MMRLALGALLLGGVVALACSQSTPDDTAEGAEQNLTALELKCSNSDRSTTFDISPAQRGVVLEGRLAGASGTSVFTCQESQVAGTDGGASSAVVSCTERPQQVHAGEWQVELTKSGRIYQGTLKKGDSGDESLLCETPARPDSGTPVALFANVNSVITSRCNGCHRGAFDSIEKIQAKRGAMISMISTGAMPRGNREWKDTPDGLRVLDFLRYSPELD